MNNFEGYMGLSSSSSSSSNATQRHSPPAKEDINRKAALSNILSQWDQADRIPVLDLSHSRNLLGQGARRPHQSLSRTLCFPALMILQSRLGQIVPGRMVSMPLTRPLEVLEAIYWRTTNLQNRLSQIAPGRMVSMPLTRPLEVLEAIYWRTTNLQSRLSQITRRLEQVILRNKSKILDHDPTFHA
jgi:hypothetical protein